MPTRRDPATMLRHPTRAAIALLALTLLLPAAAAHPVHTGCGTTQVWADAYIAQLVAIDIGQTTILGVTVPIVNFELGNAQNGIVCVGDLPDFDIRPITDLLN